MGEVRIMPQGCVSSSLEIANSGSFVLLVSPDALLALDLERIFVLFGYRVATAADGGSALSALQRLDEAAVILLDERVDWVASGRLLAAMDSPGLRKRCAIALIAEEVSDEWIARLREGVLDDIVPRSADAAAWRMHLSSMQRGHRLLMELEELRAASLLEVQHDRVTGVFHREAMLKLLFRETDRVQRLSGSLCVMAMDIDDFGHWNGELGRDGGDALLREVSARVGRLLRSYDLLGRCGAEAFLLALPGCGTANAWLLAERLRMEVFGEPFGVATACRGAVSVQLTASFGIAASGGRSPVVVVREARLALEQARSAGPDSIRCADSESRARLAEFCFEEGVLV